jgi:hypothetical protein
MREGRRRLSLGKFASNPQGIPPQVEHGKNLNLGSCFIVIDAERKSTRQHPVESKMPWVDAMKQRKTFNVCENGIRKVSPIVTRWES